MKLGSINALRCHQRHQRHRMSATYHRRARWLQCLIMLMFIVLVPVPGKAHAGYHALYGNFDIPIDAANDLLATAYYSGQFPTHLAGSLDLSGAVQVDLTVHQPGYADLDLVEGALNLDMRLRLTAAYTIGDKSETFDQAIGLRLGLQQGPNLKFAQAPIQFLDDSIPMILRDLLVEDLQARLLADSDFVVNLENVIAALPTRQSTFVSNHFSYDISLSRPFLELKHVLIKPCFQCFGRPKVPSLYDLHIPVHVAIEADGRQHAYELDIHPGLGFHGSSSSQINYVLTDEQLDIVVARIQDFVGDLPEVVQQKLESTLVGQAFPLYQGRIIDVANSAIPSDMDIRFTSQTLFTLPLTYLDYLGGRRDEIEQAFAAQGYPLTGPTALTEKEDGSRWYINDGDAGFYELIKQTSNIRVQVPAAAVDVEFHPDRIRLTFWANALSTPANFSIIAASPYTGAFSVVGNVSGRVVHLDISTLGGSEVKDFGSADLSLRFGSYSRRESWTPVSQGRYLIRAVVNTGHKLYTIVKRIVVQ